ncbi:MAG: hypothetical protein M1833_003035 [Piccolia ochrophora]|nr:MAG: hypothetical protein M1833_003035 [Piccolia ochrophora]
MAAAVPRPGHVRPKLSDILDRLASNPDDEFALEVQEEEENMVNEAIGFRWEAPKTMKRHDFHLSLYHQYVKYKLNLAGDLDADALNLHAFPEDHSRLIILVRGFLSVTCRFLRPRSVSQARPRFRTMIQYRESLLWWIKRVYGMRDTAIPFPGKMMNATNETLQAAGRKYGLATAASDKPYLGLLELTQLIEYDSLTTPCMPLAECHHLGWSIGRICGVRPGSMGEDRTRRGHFLSWRDIQITRTDVKGAFNVDMVFRHLKGHNDGLEMKQTLKFKLTSADKTNLTMSVPHRLLIILLRRQAMKDYSTIEQLLAGDQRNILVKDGFLDKPVLLAGGPRGLSLKDQDSPMTAEALTDYLSRRGRNYGYTKDISMYAWRRRTATEFTDELGRDQARAMLGHDPSTFTLEKYYHEGYSNVDVTSLQLRQARQNDPDAAALDRSEVGLNVVDAAKCRGLFLQQAVAEMATNDPERVDEDPKSTRNYFRRLRRAAQRALLEQQRDLLRAKMTQTEFESRKKAADKPSVLVEQFMKRAKQLSTAARNVSEFSNREDVDDQDDNYSLRPDDVRDYEIETTTSNNATREVNLANEDEGPQNDNEDDIDYAFAVQGFMECVLFGGFDNQTDFEHDRHQATATRQRQRHQGPNFVPRRCPLCLEDPTASRANKERVWTVPVKLKDHVRSSYHQPYRAFLRGVEARRSEDPNGKYVCPYCDQMSQDTASDISAAKYTNRNKLIEHIRKSPASLGTRHEDLKKADGWYDADWNYDFVAAQPAKARALRRQIGWNFDDCEELKESIPHPTNPGIVLGGPNYDYTQGRHADTVICCSPGSGPFVDHHPGMTGGNDRQATEANDRAVKQLIEYGLAEYVPFPGTEQTQRKKKKK